MTQVARCVQDATVRFGTGMPWPLGALTAATAAAVTSRVVTSSPAALAAFRAFLEFLLAKYYRRNQAAFAKAIGITARSLRRTIDPREGKHTFSLEHCLTLAKAVQHHCNATHVLIQADKADLDHLIRDLYGAAKLGPREQTLLDAWNELDGPMQEDLLFWAQQQADIARAKRHAAEPPTAPHIKKSRTRRKVR